MENKTKMTILDRGNIVYYIKDESVVAGVNNFQWTSYNVYSLQNRKPFYDFRRTLLKSKDGEYSTILDMIRLAKRFGLKGVASSKPNEDNYENIVRR